MPAADAHENNTRIIRNHRIAAAMPYHPILAVALALAMKFCLNVCSYELTNFHHDTYEIVNDSCQRLDSKPGSMKLDYVLLLTLGFLLPTFAAYVSNMLLGYDWSLFTGGLVQLPVALSLTVVVMTAHECIKVVQIVQLVLYPILVGFIHPSLLCCLMSQPYKPRQLALLYMLMSSGGDLLGMVPTIGRHAGERQVELVILVCSVTFFLSSLTQKDDWTVVKFHAPSIPKAIVYCKIFGCSTLFVTMLRIGRDQFSQVAMEFYLNEAGEPIQWWQEIAIPAAFELGTALTAVVALLLNRWNLSSCCWRMVAAAVICIADEVALGLVNLPAAYDLLTNHPYVVFNAHVMAAVIHGVVNAVAFSAVYELAEEVALPSCKIFLFGILYSVWSSGAAWNFIFVQLFSSNLWKNPPLHPRHHGRVTFYWGNVTNILLAILTIIYVKIIVQPLARRAERWVREEVEESQPLLGIESNDADQTINS